MKTTDPLLRHGCPLALPVLCYSVLPLTAKPHVIFIAAVITKVLPLWWYRVVNTSSVATPPNHGNHVSFTVVFTLLIKPLRLSHTSEFLQSICCESYFVIVHFHSIILSDDSLSFDRNEDTSNKHNTEDTLVLIIKLNLSFTEDITRSLLISGRSNIFKVGFCKTLLKNVKVLLSEWEQTFLQVDTADTVWSVLVKTYKYSFLCKRSNLWTKTIIKMGFRVVAWIISRLRFVLFHSALLVTNLADLTVTLAIMFTSCSNCYWIVWELLISFYYPASSTNAVADGQAFLFTLVNPSGSGPVKISLAPGASGGIRCNQATGPHFGTKDCYDLRIWNGSYSNLDLGHGFTCPENEYRDTYFTGKSPFQVDELEVFKIQI